MLGLAGRKLLYLVPVLLAVTALTFLIAALLPGDLAIAMLGDQATPENVAALHQKLGLDLPLWRQYLHWLTGVLSGDLGTSYRTGETVTHAIAERLPVSLELLVIAQLGGLLIGVPLAMLCAVRPDSVVDRMVSGLAFGTLSVPPFLLGIVLIYVFALRLGVLPATAYVPLSGDLIGNLRGMALPGATLALLEWPAIMRVLRSDLISTLQEDYIAMARAKGLTARRILFVHALKPSSLTLVTVVGLNIGRLIGGAVIIESIFALPGVGRLLVESIYTRDFIVLQGGVLFVAVAFVAVNFLVDLLYAALDPRTRHGPA
jgi:peptide/nickel transport system permease protein